MAELTERERAEREEIYRPFRELCAELALSLERV